MDAEKHLQINALRLGLYEVGHARLGRDWNYRRLSSPFSRIYLIEKGEAVIRHSGQTHHLHNGDLHLIPCHITADYQCPEFHTQFFVGFTARIETGLDLFTLRHCDLTLQADQKTTTLFQQLTNLLSPFTKAYGRLGSKNIPLATQLEARGIVLQLAAVFLQTAHEPTATELEREGRFAPILQFIDQNLPHDIPLETLANLAGLTPTYFSDLFAQTLGVRPVEFINRHRIERAQLLLATTDMTAQQIADATGFRSAAYFSRLFHRIAGIPPARYRKLLLKP